MGDSDTMTYKIGEWGKARNDFWDAFGISIQPLYDGLMTLVFGCIQIDPCEFDEYLYKVHKDYVEGISMEEIILKHYGQKGLGVFNALIPSEEAMLNERVFKLPETENK